MRGKIRASAIVAAVLVASSAARAQGTYRQTVPLDPVNIDRSANACVDFNQFANGGWIRSNPLPAAYSRWGSFDELGERNQEALTKLLASASSSTAGQNRNVRMLGAYYASCMDSAGAERAGAAPLRPRIARISRHAIEVVADAEKELL